jgi:hypothetical protein
MKICSKCVLPETYPGISFNEKGICNLCTDKTHSQERNNPLFASEEQLKDCLNKYKQVGGKYDVLVPISGGVDSCYTLIKLVETYGLRPLVFHNDHGYEYETATDNVKKMCRKYDLDLIIWQHDLEFMKKIWRSLTEYNGLMGSFSCFICGSVIAANAIELAKAFNIKLIINGFTKGQADMCRPGGKGEGWINDYIQFLEKKDKQLLDKYLNKMMLFPEIKFFESRKDLENNDCLNQITLIPFFIFKFYKTDKDQLKKECIKRFNWKNQEISYPDKTTNCKMNWISSYMDMKRMNCTWYHEEYSLLIRKGEISRDEALMDLKFNPPDGLIETLLSDLNAS